MHIRTPALEPSGPDSHDSRVGAIRRQAPRQISAEPRHSRTGRVPHGASIAARARARRALFGALTTAYAPRRFAQRPAGAVGGGVVWRAAGRRRRHRHLARLGAPLVAAGGRCGGGCGSARRRPPASAPAPGAVGRFPRRRRRALGGGYGLARRGPPPPAAAHGAVARLSDGHSRGLWAARGFACLALLVAGVFAQLCDVTIALPCGCCGFWDSAFYGEQYRSTSVRWLEWAVELCASCFFTRSRTRIPCAPLFPHVNRLPCGPSMSADTTACATTMPVYIDSCFCGRCSGAATTPPSAHVSALSSLAHLSQPPSLLLALRRFPPPHCPTPPRYHTNSYS